MKKKALYIFDNFGFGIDKIYSPDDQKDVAELVDIYAPPQKSNILQTTPKLLGDVEIILSGWQAPKFDAEFLDAAQKLEIVFYAASSIRGIVDDAFWQRGIKVSTSQKNMAGHVADFTFAQIILCLKQAYKAITDYYKHKDFFRKQYEDKVVGTYGSTIGLISLGAIGRMTAERLKSLNVKLLAYDPFISQSEAAQLGVEMASLNDIFINCDCISLHTPWLKETEKMITGRHFELMKENASFINTARGAVIDENEMIEVLRQRPDIFACLDVTHPDEPPRKDSALWDLPNVLLTPHIAGNAGNERCHLGRAMVDELRRYINNEPLKCEVKKEQAEFMA